MITYDKINGLLYISFQHQELEEEQKIKSIEIDEGLFVDYDEVNKQVVGIELVDTERAKYLHEAIVNFQEHEYIHE
jgi:uncharacterized protein YuzE|tara:strand:- start:1599 stop:1826 length:228 start_codon:yes stop_codon:yes gene_type:complete